MASESDHDPCEGDSNNTVEEHDPTFRQICVHSTTLSPSQSISASSNISNKNLQLEEMAVAALQSFRTPKDDNTALCKSMSGELRNLSTEQAEFARSKLNRAFLDIMGEAKAMVSAIIFPLYSVHIDASLRYIFPIPPPPPSQSQFFLLQPGDMTFVSSAQPSTLTIESFVVQSQPKQQISKRYANGTY